VARAMSKGSATSLIAAGKLYTITFYSEIVLIVQYLLLQTWNIECSPELRGTAFNVNEMNSGSGSHYSQNRTWYVFQTVKVSFENDLLKFEE
jgi:hypothetical protein